jgi:hypothetical protein
MLEVPDTIALIEMEISLFVLIAEFVIVSLFLSASATRGASYVVLVNWSVQIKAGKILLR